MCLVNNSPGGWCFQPAHYPQNANWLTICGSVTPAEHILMTAKGFV